jgi:hypothetical protein
MKMGVHMANLVVQCETQNAATGWGSSMVEFHHAMGKMAASGCDVPREVDWAWRANYMVVLL